MSKLIKIILMCLMVTFMEVTQISAAGIANGEFIIDTIEVSEDAPIPYFPNPNELRDAALTAKEIELLESDKASFKIGLAVNEVDPTREEEQKVREALKDSRVFMYLDISMYKQSNASSNKEAIKVLNDEITILFDVHSLLREGEKFSVIRLHQDGTAVLKNLSKDPSMLIFKTDRFCTYAIVYDNVKEQLPEQPKYMTAETAKALLQGANNINSGHTNSTSSNQFGVMKDAWQNLGVLEYQHDTLSGNAVAVRLSVYKPGLITQDMLVSGYVDTEGVGQVKALFEKWFSNKLRVIHMDNTQPWGQEVQIAAKVDLAGINTANLVFYNYNPVTNTYSLILSPKHYVDASGYLHVYTERGGDIIISEGELTH